MNEECHCKYFFSSHRVLVFRPNYTCKMSYVLQMCSVLLGLNHPWMLWPHSRYLKQSSQSVSQSVCGVILYGLLGWQSVKIQFFRQHRDHAGNLLFLTEARVFGPGLKAGGHHVVDSCQNLHNLQLLAKLIEDVAQRLDKPGATPRVPPWVIPWKISTS